MPRRLLWALLALGVVLLVGLGLLFASDRSPSPSVPDGSSEAVPSVPAERSPVPVPDGGAGPGSPLRDGFVVPEGALLVSEPVVRSEGGVAGWFAVLDLSGSAEEVAARFRVQLLDRGFDMVGNEVLSSGELSGAFVLEGHRLGSLDGAAGPVVVEVVRVDVVPPLGEAPGFVRVMVTGLS